MSLDQKTTPQKSLLKRTQEFFYNIWCFICLYTLGALYIPIELNRKYNLVMQVRKLDPDKDLPASLTGNVCIITGGSRGIGWEAAKVLLVKGCHVIVASSVTPGQSQNQLREKLNRDAGKTFKGRLEVWHLDLSSFDSVLKFVDKFRTSGYHLNVLINNAGQMYAPFSLTADKFESHLAINYLSHCLLVTHLLPFLEKTGISAGVNSRIINVASSTHYARNMNFTDLNGLEMYSSYHAYAQSKLAQIMYTYKLHNVLNTNDFYHVNVNSLHPGVAKTELYEHVWWVIAFPFIADLLFRTAKEGAETVLFAAYSPELEGVGGKYLEDCAITKSSAFSYDQDSQDKLWNQTAIALAPWLEKVEKNLFFSKEQ